MRTLEHVIAEATTSVTHRHYGRLDDFLACPYESCRCLISELKKWGKELRFRTYGNYGGPESKDELMPKLDKVHRLLGLIGGEQENANENA